MTAKLATVSLKVTVRKYVAAGKLAQAVLPDGTLDTERADQLLASFE